MDKMASIPYSSLEQIQDGLTMIVLPTGMEEVKEVWTQVKLYIRIRMRHEVFSPLRS